MAYSYSHTQRWYSINYGLPLGTIQNCVRRKWPLDHPTKLLEKFLNGRGKRPDLAKLQDFASGGKKLRRKATKSATPPTPVDLGKLGIGLNEELERVKAECARSFEEYRAETNPATRIALQKIWTANVAAMRQLAKPARQAEQDLKNLISRSDVEATWTRLLVEFRSALEALPRRVSFLALFKSLDPVEVEQALLKEVTAVMAQLERTFDPSTDKEPTTDEQA